MKKVYMFASFILFASCLFGCRRTDLGELQDFYKSINNPKQTIIAENESIYNENIEYILQQFEHLVNEDYDCYDISGFTYSATKHDNDIIYVNVYYSVDNLAENITYTDVMSINESMVVNITRLLLDDFEFEDGLIVTFVVNDRNGKVIGSSQLFGSEYEICQAQGWDVEEYVSTFDFDVSY